MGAFADCGETLIPYVQGTDLVPIGGGYVYVTPAAAITVSMVTFAGDSISVSLPPGMVFPLKIRKILAATVASAGTLWVMPDPY
jgi:hypothetical protein